MILIFQTFMEVRKNSEYKLLTSTRTLVCLLRSHRESKKTPNQLYSALKTFFISNRDSSVEFNIEIYVVYILLKVFASLKLSVFNEIKIRSCVFN